MKTRSQNRVARFKPEEKQKHPMLRARVRQCDGDLIPLLKRAAEILRLDEADVIRIGTQQYASSVVYRAPAVPSGHA